MWPGSGNAKFNDVGTRVGVRIHDRLPQRVRTIVRGILHRIGQQGMLPFACPIFGQQCCRLYGASCVFQLPIATKADVTGKVITGCYFSTGDLCQRSGKQAPFLRSSDITTVDK